MDMTPAIAPPRERRAAPWWAGTRAMLAFTILSTVPLWFARTPPLIDFVGHLARYHVALGIDRNPILQRDWSYDWALIGNLGVDLLIMPLARAVGLEAAGWLVAAALPPLMIWGIFRAARAVHGELPPAAIATLPFALGYYYQYGFVNYWLASALAFHAFAGWVLLERRPGLRAALFAPVAWAVWLCHAYGWGVLGVLVGGYELSRAGAPGGWRAALRSGATAAGRTWPLLTVAAAMVVWRSNGEGAETLGWFDMRWKLHAATLTLRDQWRAFDLLTLGAAALLVYYGCRDGRARMDGRFGVAALLFLGALLVIPYQLFGSAYADARVYPFLFVAALLSVQPGGDAAGRRVARLVPIGFAALFAVRVAVSAVGYAEYDAAYRRHLRALDGVERGAGVAVLVRTPCDKAWRLERLDHLGAMATVRRDAFVNSQWDVPGAELLRPRRAAGTAFNADPSQFVLDPGCPADLRPALGAKLARLPRRTFDYVWVLGFDPASLPAYPGLKPVHRDEASVLYRASGR